MLASRIARRLARFLGITRVWEYKGATCIAVRRLFPDWVWAQTLGEVILVREEHANDASLLRHELVHVADWQRYGTLGFSLRYGWGYLAALMHYGPARAYRMNYWERKAYGDFDHPTDGT